MTRNHKVYSVERPSMNTSQGAMNATGSPGDPRTQKYIDAQLLQITRRILRVLGTAPAGGPTRSVRQTLLWISGSYGGSEMTKFSEFCRALDQMSRLDFRAAIRGFERVLIGQVDADFEVFREIALQAHSVCLEELDFDEESMEQFTQLLYTKFEETRANNRPDDVARLLGLGPIEAPMTL